MQRRAILERMLEKTNRSQHFFLTIRPILSSISANSDQTNSIPLPEVFEKPLFARILQVTGLLSLAPLGACEPAVEQGYQPPVPAQSTCGADSELRASLYGSIETTLQWTGSDMGCESMPRPNGEGIRLRISGDVLGEQLAFILAMPGLRPGEQGIESPTNVTATVEGSGRFFSTPDLDSCFTDVTAQTPLPDHVDQYALAGTLFCVAPLGELNGDSAISIPSLTFNAVINWASK